MDNTKFEAIKAYLLGEGNYDFPFNKYVESVQLKTGEELHPFVWFAENFYDDPYIPELCDWGKKFPYDLFARLVKNSPTFNPDNPFVWYDSKDGQLHSAKTIFPDVYDVDKVAAWCVENNDDLDWDDDIHAILFGKEK